MRKNILIFGIIALLLIEITPVITSSSEVGTNNTDESYCYGSIINIDEKQCYALQTNISILINRLLSENITVYWICEDISSRVSNLSERIGSNVRLFKKGCFVVPFTDDIAHDSLSTAILYYYNMSKNVEIYYLREKLTDIKIHVLVEPKLAYFDRISIEFFNYYNCLNKGGFLNHEILNCDDILNGKLKNDKYNVLIHGGQQAYYIDVIGDSLNPITRLSYLKIKNFIKNGGGYVGSCFGAYSAASGMHRPSQLPIDLQYSKFSNLITIQMNIIDRKVYRALPGASGYSTRMWGNESSGITMRIINSDNPTSFGLPEIIEGLEYVSGPMFLEKKFGKSNTEDVAVIENIGDEETYCWEVMMLLCPWYKDYIPDSIVKNKLDKWVNYSIGKSVWVTSKYGDGKVVAFGGHPEFLGTRSPPRIVYNAIFYACSDGPFEINIDKGKTIFFEKISCNGPYETYPLENICFSGELTDINPSNSWAWSFGDSKFGTNQTTTHNYKDYGEYDLILTMCNGSKQLFVDKSKVLILGNLNIKPLHYNLKIDEITTFNADINGGFKPVSYLWDLGDKTISNLEKPCHKYTDEGIYKCKLTVEDRLNNERSRKFLVVVNNNNNNYIVNLKTNIEEKANINETIDFIINITPEEPCEYNLSFDDGFSYQGITSQEPPVVVSHSYKKPGIYYPTIIVKNNKGEIVISDTQIIVNTPPDKPNINNISSEISIGQRCILSYGAKDDDGDILWYEYEFDSESYGNATKKFKYKSQEIAILYAIAFVEGEHHIRIRAIDPYDAKSEWSEPLVINVSKGDLWKRPVLRLHRYFRIHPDNFPRIQEILFQI